MSLTRAYLEGPLAEGIEFELSAEVQRRLVQVLRMRAGDQFIAFDGQGGEFEATLSRVEKRTARAIIEQRIEADRESRLKITLAQSVGKGDRMDWAVQKAVETGASVVVPLLSERCNVSIDAPRQAKRLQHWQGVIVAACEQSGRTRLPELAAFTDFARWVAQDPAPVKLLLDASGEPLRQVLPEGLTDLSLTVGPEGGFSDDELAMARSAGFRIVRLGPRILRNETAGIAAISALQVLSGDWS